MSNNEKDLSHELGRWKKRCEDLQKRIDELNTALSEHDAAVQSISAAMDATLMQVAMHYGKGSTEAEVAAICYRMPNVAELMTKYKLSCNLDDNGMMHVAVLRKNDGEAEQG